MAAEPDGAALREEVARIRWFHSIQLAPGLVTPGRADTTAQVPRLHLPDLRGKTVLDVGAWDGFFSFVAERRGAARVVAVDTFAWQERGQATGKAGFELARRALGSHVEDVEVDVLDISPETVGGTFDVVLFLGVLYHMRHPLLAIERLRSVTRELLVLETHVDMLGTRRPAMAFYPGFELDSDWSNWWGPNPAAVIAMLEQSGFTSAVQVHPRSSIPGRAARALRALSGPTGTNPRTALLRQGRAVFHAKGV
ncbi:MAG: class I SAM-dependent methyltransferase [Thermoleophilaceae bacterium]